MRGIRGSSVKLSYVCESCGQPFTFVVRRGRLKRRFCSQACTDQAFTRKIEKRCPICSTSFRTPPSQYRVTCSKACSNRWKTKPIGQSSQRQARVKLRQQILSAKPAICQLCGEDRYVEIAHLIARSRGGADSPENVAVLCGNCHRLFDQGKIGREKLLRKIRSFIFGVRMKKVHYQVDARGRLAEIFTRRDPIWIQPAHLYVTSVAYGVVKGWHLHQFQADNFFCLEGTIRLALWDVRPDSSTFGLVNEFVMGMNSPMVVQIPPGVLHGFKGLDMPESLVLNASSRVYNPQQPDEIRVAPHAGEEQRSDLERFGLPFDLVPFDWNTKDR